MKISSIDLLTQIDILTNNVQNMVIDVLTNNVQKRGCQS